MKKCKVCGKTARFYEWSPDGPADYFCSPKHHAEYLDSMWAKGIGWRANPLAELTKEKEKWLEKEYLEPTKPTNMIDKINVEDKIRELYERRQEAHEELLACDLELDTCLREAFDRGYDARGVVEADIKNTILKFGIKLSDNNFGKKLTKKKKKL